MARNIQIHQIDAFTRTPFTGNPAGVVVNAAGLRDTMMGDSTLDFMSGRG